MALLVGTTLKPGDGVGKDERDSSPLPTPTTPRRTLGVPHVANPQPEEPDAGNPQVRIRGSPGGAIPWGHSANRAGAE